MSHYFGGRFRYDYNCPDDTALFIGIADGPGFTLQGHDVSPLDLNTGLPTTGAAYKGGGYIGFYVNTNGNLAPVVGVPGAAPVSGTTAVPNIAQPHPVGLCNGTHTGQFASTGNIQVHVKVTVTSQGVNPPVGTAEFYWYNATSFADLGTGTLNHLYTYTGTLPKPGNNGSGLYPTLEFVLRDGGGGVNDGHFMVDHVYMGGKDR